MASGIIFAGLIIFGVTIAGQGQSLPDVNGGWTPWELDPSIDCCIYGNFARYRRYCTNPTPERNGTKCVTSNGTYASTEDTWRTCQCGCDPPCNLNYSFCANDTTDGPVCMCNYPLIPVDYQDYLNTTECVEPTTTAATIGTTVPVTLDPDTKKSKNIAQYISMLILLGCLAACFVLMIFFYGFKTLRIIQMNQEITLAATYALIAFLIESTSNKGLCMTISILVHYLFMCTMTFYCLEALHTYSMITYVVPVRGYLSAIVNIALGYGIPVIPLAFSVGFLYNSYGNNGRHCWCDISAANTGQAWAFLFPICFGALACAVIAEAQGQGKYEPLPGTDQIEYRSAKVSQITIMITMPLSVASYVVGLLAVDLQIWPVYIVFFVLTVLLGVAILLSHTAASPRLAGMCPCGSTSGGNPGRIAPSPQPHPMKMY